VEKINGRRNAASRATWAIIAIVIIVAGSGAYIYYTSYTAAGTFRTGKSVPSNIILTGSASAGFYKGSVVTFDYTKNYDCIPALSTPIAPSTNETETEAAAAKTTCQVGSGNAGAEPNAAPLFILVPVYAGLSIFGVGALGATSQGYPVFNNNVVFTQCGAGGTTSACADHPTLVYSPYFTLVEQHLGIKNGYGGLPEGVLPVPSHSHVVNYEGGPSIPWYVVTVLVFDPNIMPDGQTGQCHQWVNSDLSNPTANCLTSFSALGNAMSTKTSATKNANNTQNDPVYDTLGGVQNQVVILGVSVVSDTSSTNTNLFLWFSVASSNPFGS